MYRDPTGMGTNDTLFAFIGLFGIFTIVEQLPSIFWDPLGKALGRIIEMTGSAGVFISVVPTIMGNLESLWQTIVQMSYVTDIPMDDIGYFLIYGVRGIIQELLDLDALLKVGGFAASAFSFVGGLAATMLDPAVGIFLTVLDGAGALAMPFINIKWDNLLDNILTHYNGLYDSIENAFRGMGWVFPPTIQDLMNFLLR